MTFEVIDLFCGAGGTSTGILKAIKERMGKKARLTAVNHWPTAVNTHTLNHPEVKHICETVENLHPLDLVKSGRLDLLAASCECRFHSNARGGGVCNEQSRSQPWQLVRWATDIGIENILMENVWEFTKWGPLLTKNTRIDGKTHKKGHPDPRRKGEHFRALVNAFVNLGYNVDFRRQIACDFGDPTSRPRLMLMARKGGIVWPEPSHGPCRATPYRTAWEIIDWSLPGISIFERHLYGLPPLRPNTIRRIIAGLRKFGGAAAEPFIAILNGTSDGHIEASALSLGTPLPSIVASGNHFMLCEPFLSAYHNGPSGERRNHSLREPLPTQDTSNRFALVEPIIVQTDQTGGNGICARPLNRPLPSIVTKQNMLLIEPLILKYYKTGRCKSTNAPLDSVTTKPRFMLIQCGRRTEVQLDIRTRMLQPHELARAHSFPIDYQFTGNKEEQTKQIGNSVPVEMAAAHAEAILS